MARILAYLHKHYNAFVTSLFRMSFIMLQFMSVSLIPLLILLIKDSVVDEIEALEFQW